MYKNPSNGEQTLVVIKTEGVQRGLIGESVRRFEKRGFKLAACKFMSAGRSESEISGAKTGDPVVAMVWEGLNVVESARALIGSESDPGTIRGDYSVDPARNLAHASGSLAVAGREISACFVPGELTQWKAVNLGWIYEDEEDDDRVQEVGKRVLTRRRPRLEHKARLCSLHTVNTHWIWRWETTHKSTLTDSLTRPRPTGDNCPNPIHIPPRRFLPSESDTND